MDQIKPPSHLQCTGNVGESWRRFIQAFELYLMAIGADSKSDKQRIAIFLTVAGQEALEIYNTFTFTDEEKDKYDSVRAKVEVYCKPKINETYERFVFRMRMLKTDELFDNWLTDITNLTKNCHFGTLRDSLIRDQIVIGTNDPTVQGRLLREAELDLPKAIQICKAAETASKQLKLLQSTSDKHVDFVNQKNTTFRAGALRRPAYRNGTYRGRGQIQVGARGGTVTQVKCYSCGKVHEARNCPAHGKTCHKCGKLNHFATVCKAYSPHKTNKIKKVHALDEHDEQEVYTDTLFVGAINNISLPNETLNTESDDMPLLIDAIEAENDDDWITPIETEDVIIPYKLDTGSQMDILPLKDYENIRAKKRIIKNSVKLEAYNNQSIPCVGMTRLTLTLKHKTYKVMFAVIDTDNIALLGKKTPVFA